MVERTSVTNARNWGSSLVRSSEWMTTASSIRSSWEKFFAMTCWACIEAGLLVMLPSEVNADPSRVAMATMDASRTSPHAVTTRQGRTAAERASRWVMDVPCACTGWPSPSCDRVANMVSPLVGSTSGLVPRGLAGAAVLGCDPGGEDAVGVVGKVVAGQGVQQVRVVVEMGTGEGDELPVRGGDGVVHGADEVRLRGFGHQRSRHKKAGGVVAPGAVEDLGRRRGVAADQTAE